MRILVLGNSGAGKTTFAGRLAAEHDLVHLDLDTVAWEPDSAAVPRAPAAVRADLDAFVARHTRWVADGCYGDLAEWLAPHATRLDWLDVGLDVCLAHHRARPWEPHKYADPAEQERRRAFLENWVRQYDQREDFFGRAWHQSVFDAFQGEKVRWTSIPRV